MKKILAYRKALGVDENASLKDLKSVYRNVMKEWHPDKFQDDAERADAEKKSAELIEAYHFLVSIAPETREQLMPEYMETTGNCVIVDMNFKYPSLQLSFSDGNTYEYFDVPKALYVKLVNAETQGRFARRHIYTSFVYRNISKLVNVQA